MVFTRCSLSVHSVFTLCSLSIHMLFRRCSLGVHSMLTRCSVGVYSVITQCCVTKITLSSFPRFTWNTPLGEAHLEERLSKLHSQRRWFNFGKKFGRRFKVSPPPPPRPHAVRPVGGLKIIACCPARGRPPINPYSIKLILSLNDQFWAHSIVLSSLASRHSLPNHLPVPKATTS